MSFQVQILINRIKKERLICALIKSSVATYEKLCQIFISREVTFCGHSISPDLYDDFAHIAP